MKMKSYMAGTHILPLRSLLEHRAIIFAPELFQATKHNTHGPVRVRVAHGFSSGSVRGAAESLSSSRWSRRELICLLQHRIVARLVDSIIQ